MTLTLEQVKQAGRFAWHPSCMVFDGATVLRVSVAGVLRQGVEMLGVQPVQFVIESATRTITVRETNGWHHLPGCDCEFCREEAK